MKQKKAFASILIIDLTIFMVISIIAVFQSNMTFYGANMLYSFLDISPNKINDTFVNGIIYILFILLLIIPYIKIISLLKKDTEIFKNLESENVAKNLKNAYSDSGDKKLGNAYLRPSNKELVRNCLEQNEKNVALLKNNDDVVHSNIKFVIIFILLVSAISIFILPNNSGDVYYYIATGRMSSIYKLNPYNITLNEARNIYPDDPVLANCYKYSATYAYCGIWLLICKMLSCIPTNSNILLLLLFKVLSIVIHLFNCYLIFKLSLIHKKEQESSNNKFRLKEIFSIYSPSQINKALINTFIYALNPLVIIDLLINCHNDVLLVFSILLAFYLKKTHRTNQSILAITFGALIKYFPLMFLPYLLDEEKSKKKVLAYVLESAAIFIGITFLVSGSVKNMTSFLTQASLYSASFYLWILTFLNYDFQTLKTINRIGKVVFIALYFYSLTRLYIKEKKKKISDEVKMSIYMILIISFIIIALTSIRSWYYTWILVCIPFFDVDKDNFKLSVIMNATISMVISISVMYLFGETYMMSKYTFLIFIILSIVFCLADKINEKKVMEAVTK